MMQAPAHPVEEAVVRFGDWLAACDTARSCEALSWPTTGPGDDPISVSISRQAADSVPMVTVSFEPPGWFASDAGSSPVSAARRTVRDPARPLTVQLDDQPMDISPWISGSSLVFSEAEHRILWNELPQAETLVISTQQGQVIGRVSLWGLDDVVKAFDDVQAREARPVPVRQPPESGVPPEAVQSSELTWPLSEYGCKALGEIETYRLDADHTLALPLLECEDRMAGWRAAFVKGPEGLSQALFREPGEDHLGVRGPLSNVGFDAGDRRLSVFRENAGYHGCGISVTYAWDGAILAAVHREELGGCTWFRRTLTTWRAAVTVEAEAEE